MSYFDTNLFSLFASRFQNIDQPRNTFVGFAAGLFQNIAIFINIVKALSNFDEPSLFVAGDAGAVNAGAAGFAIVGLPIPAVEGEFDALSGLMEISLEVGAGDSDSVNQVEVLSQGPNVLHNAYLRFVRFPFGCTHIRSERTYYQVKSSYILHKNEPEKL